MGGITSPPISCPERRRWSLNSPSRRQGETSAAPLLLRCQKKKNRTGKKPALCSDPFGQALELSEGQPAPAHDSTFATSKRLGCEQEGRRCLPPWTAASRRAAAAFHPSFPRRAHGEAARLHGNELEGSTEEKPGKKLKRN